MKLKYIRDGIQIIFFFLVIVSGIVYLSIKGEI